MNKEKINVLITGGGGPGYPLFYKALRHSRKYDVRIVATEINRYAGNIYRSDWVDAAYLTKKNSDPEFIDQICGIARREKIDFLYSGIDEELPVFARNRNMLDELGCKIVLPSESALNMAFDKWATYNRLEGTVRQPETLRIVPDTQFDAESIMQRFKYRAKVKGARTRGNRLNFLAETVDDLNFYTHYLQRLGADFIVQQYISGREFNVSIMADNSGEILYAICREKLDDEQKRPNTNAGCIIRNPDMEAAAIDVVKKMKLYPGCSNVEFLLDESGQYYVIDVNGGRHAAQDYNLIHSGINIPEMLIDISRDNTPDMIDNTQIKSGVICIKYLDELIVEMNDIDSYWEESGS